MHCHYLETALITIEESLEAVDEKILELGGSAVNLPT
jgi:hypothetical protein